MIFAESNIAEQIILDALSSRGGASVLDKGAPGWRGSVGGWSARRGQRAEGGRG